jgi:hypothetical protein
MFSVLLSSCTNVPSQILLISDWNQSFQPQNDQKRTESTNLKKAENKHRALLKRLYNPPFNQGQDFNINQSKRPVEICGEKRI